MFLQVRDVIGERSPKPLRGESNDGTRSEPLTRLTIIEVSICTSADFSPASVGLVTDSVATTRSALLPPPTAARQLGAPNRATLEDVARLAGVSGKTVSRVVTGHPSVSVNTREKVWEAARMLRFRPNQLARDLRNGGASTTVGFVIGDLTNPFYSQVADGIEQTLTEQSLTMIVAGTRDDPAVEARVVAAMLERRVRALLLVPISDDQSYLEGERRLGTPIICIDRPARHLVADSVVFDDRSGTADAVRSLIQAGHRRIGFVGSNPTLYTHGNRLTGYRDALREAGISPSQKWERTDAPDDRSAEAATQSLLGMDDPPTAIFSANNRASFGVIRAVRERSAPIAVIGFDDFELAEILGITVVAHDPRDMGRQAALLALSRHGDLSGTAHQLIIPTHLVKRGSGELPPPPC